MLTKRETNPQKRIGIEIAGFVCRGSKTFSLFWREFNELEK